MSAAMESGSMAEIVALRPYLMRVAISRVNDAERAEDLVQETLLAAIKARRSFGGRSRFRTWVTGILIHKAMDFFRARAREESLMQPFNGIEATEDSEFDRDGAWATPVSPWSNPERALENKRFLGLFAAQLATLPPMQARAFEMRELMGLESEEICRHLGVTPNNLCQLLYRARLGLRKSLERDWFSAAA
jgi:RNA polymerase sigma-70 factor, ECF subfamily